MMERDPHIDWIAEQLAKHLARALEGMAGATCEAKSAKPAGGLASGALWWAQGFTKLTGCRLWVGAPPEAWRAIGQAALAGAGIDDASDEDARGTYLELLQQAVSGLASGLTAKLLREVLPDGGAESGPEAGEALGFELSSGGKVLGSLILMVSPEFSSALAPPPAPPPTVSTSIVAQSVPGSDPFEVLLDVEMPVSVSFGRANLALRELVKLTSGAIVELNRSVNEPVELIVNNCVIARGEVVVVDGNYGVRIKQIISRRERLRTLH